MRSGALVMIVCAGGTEGNGETEGNDGTDEYTGDTILVPPDDSTGALTFEIIGTPEEAMGVNRVVCPGSTELTIGTPIFCKEAIIGIDVNVGVIAALLIMVVLVKGKGVTDSASVPPDCPGEIEGLITAGYSIGVGACIIPLIWFQLT